MNVATRFDSPVGTQAEREGPDLPPGQWYASNPFANYYRLKKGDTPDRDIYAYHTGADLLLWPGGGAHEPIFAVADGLVTFAKRVINSTWGNLICVGHTLPDGSEVYSRYGHVESMLVKAGDEVTRGQQIAAEGNAYGAFPYHLHFDISPTRRLLQYPADWPGLDLARLRVDYVDPLAFIRSHREVKELDVATMEELKAVRQKAADVVAALDGLIGSDLPTTVKYVTEDGLRVRLGPSTTYPILQTLRRGDSVAVVSEVDGWTKIGAPTSGYVSAQYLSDQAPVPNP